MNRRHEILFDVRTPLVDDARFGHNRWHPDIPPILSVAPGEEVLVDVRDGLDGQITAATTAEDVRRLDMRRGHPLTGPIEIEGAEPGDLLDVEVVRIEPDSFGSTIIIPGFGLLADRFPDPYVVRWRIEGGVARSDDLPGVAIRGVPFVGLMGVAPSRERLEQFAARERDLADRGGIALPPDSVSAVPADDPIASEALRTVPPRENGGNMDVKQVIEGSRTTFVVEVPGARFSVGDPHFAQGDGESCGVAIEVHARMTLRFGVRKAAETRWRPRYPAFEYTEPRGATEGRRFMVTTGLPLADGRNEYLDTTLAAREALGEMVDFLVAERGLSPEQAYILVSVAADLRISEIVDVPNVIVSAILPLDVFE